MRMPFRPRTRIVLSTLVVLSGVLFLMIRPVCACGPDTAEVMAATAINGSQAQTTMDLTPQTILLKFPIEENRPPLEITLKQLMETFKVPGLSVAVIDNYQIAWAQGFGVTELGGKQPVTTETLFQAGSISKPVAAVGAMWLVEQGKLTLDEDVNKKLKTWKVPENEFTKEQKVTLRRLMSHSGGLTVHGFPGYAVTEPRPTLVQIFNGEKPANTAPIRVDFVPGTRMRYSGGGITIEQQLMVDVTGKPFPQFMQQTVLRKIGMTDSSYEQPLPAARAALTATGTRMDGKSVEGRWHIYPEMAAAGLWTTPTDLAKFAIEIALSKQGKANHVLTQKSVQEMLTRQIAAEGGGSMGLGFFLEVDGIPDAFGHGGADEGFQAQLSMDPATGRGIAIMGNSDAFFHVFPYAMESIRRSRGWKNSTEPYAPAAALILIATVKNTDAALKAYSRLKQGAVPGYSKPNETTLNQFGYMLMNERKLDDAIKVFQLNVQEYPQGWNCYDSLGEAYMNAGQKELAIKNYEKSLELNPDNKNGAEMLKKLKGQ